MSKSKKILWSYNWILLHLVPLPLVVCCIFQLHCQSHLIQNLAFTVFAFLSPSQLAPSTLTLYSFQAFIEFFRPCIFPPFNIHFKQVATSKDFIFMVQHSVCCFGFSFLSRLGWAGEICQEAATSVPDCLHLCQYLTTNSNDHSMPIWLSRLVIWPLLVSPVFFSPGLSVWLQVRDGHEMEPCEGFEASSRLLLWKSSEP